MSDGNGFAEAMLGLDGLRMLEVTETTDELVITVEATATVVGCRRRGTRAEAHDRRPVEVRDLACFGRPVRLGILKRRWRCVGPDWLACAVFAHNLIRWTDQLTVARTVRARLIALPGRLVNRSGRPTLRLPRDWPWA